MTPNETIRTMQQYAASDDYLDGLTDIEIQEVKAERYMVAREEYEATYFPVSEPQNNGWSIVGWSYDQWMTRLAQAIDRLVERMQGDALDD